MESLFPNVSGDNIWEISEEFLKNTLRIGPIMNTAENMQCDTCNKRNETIRKREEVVWQREDVIYAREKSLRERELLLEEKHGRLIEEETRLKLENERLLKLERTYTCSAEENKKCITCKMDDSASFALQQSEKVKSGFFLEKERLLNEKEIIILEKTKIIEIQEQELLKKEKLVNAKRGIADLERNLEDERTISLEKREQIVKNMERVLDTKLKDMSEKLNFLDDRERLLNQKENALSDAAELLLKRENFLSERENSIIDKESNVMKQILNFASKRESEGNYKSIEGEKFIDFDKVMNDKLLSLQQRENTVSQSEEVLEKKWKNYLEAQELLKLKEIEISDVKSTCEKEKLMLAEWSKILEKQDNEITEKLNMSGTNIAEKQCEALFMDSNKIPACDLHVSSQIKTSTGKNISPIHSSRVESQHCHVNNEQKLAANEESVPLNVVMHSDDNAVSGDEFFRRFEKGREELQQKLLSNETESTAMEKSNKSTEQEHTKVLFNNSACGRQATTVQQILDRMASKKASNNIKNKNMECSVPEITNRTHSSPSYLAGTTRKKIYSLKGEDQENASAMISEEVSDMYCGNAYANKDHLSSIYMSQITSISPDKLIIKNPPTSGSAVDENLLSPEKNISKETLNRKSEINNGIVNFENCVSVLGKVTEHKSSSSKSDTKMSMHEENIPSLKSKTECGILCDSVIGNLCSDVPSALEEITEHENSSPKRDKMNKHEENVSSVIDKAERVTLHDSVVINTSSDLYPALRKVTDHEVSSSKSNREMSRHEENVPSLKDKAERSILHDSVVVNTSSDSSPKSSRSVTPTVRSGYSIGTKKQRRPSRDALLHSITNRNYKEANQLLDMNCMPLELRDDTGRSALLLTVKMGNLELLDRLIEMGASTTACDFQGYSALHIAVHENNSDMVVLLLKKGLDPHVTDNNGNTALYSASRSSDTSLLNIMKEYISSKSK